MADRKTLSDDDRALFRDAVGDVRSVNHDRVEQQRPERARKPRPDSASEDDRSVMASLLEELSEADLLETGEHLAWVQPGVQRSVLRKLKSGRYAIQGEVDLHGYTVAEAKSELNAFLVHMQQQRRLGVRVIHGKGRRQAHQSPRLKAAVNQWLQRNRQVLAFCSAPANDGGTGAVYVLLRRPGGGSTS